MKRVLFAVFALLLLPVAHAADSDQLLDAEQAFVFSAHADGPDRVVAQWNIADGYYLYRNKFAFRSETGGVHLGTAVFPPSTTKKDPAFGEVQVYHGTVRVEIPVRRDAGAPTSFTLSADSRGCAEAGVCYTPLTQTATITLPAAAATVADGAGAPDKLKNLAADTAFGDNGEFLPVDKAFAMSAAAADASTLVVRWKIADGYYLYQDKLHFSLAQPPAGVSLGSPQMPEPEKKQDPYLGPLKIYHGDLEVRLPVRGAKAGQALQLKVGYQGCAAAGLCYPPEKRQVALTLPANAAAAAAASAPPPATKVESGKAAETTPLSEQDRLAQILKGNIWIAILTFYGLGLLLTFTPCVLPMIPILSGIIVGQGDKISTRRAFVLSVAYVLPMALVYAIAGVLAGLFGGNLQAAFQEPWILGTFAAIFVVLAFSMFGFYELQMPAAIQGRLNELSNRQQGGTLIGVGIMGVLSALIVGPCVTAPLVAALIYIGQTGDAVLGGLALFALGLGMGTPLLAIGTSAGRLLPHAGSWMEVIKAVFGVILLGVAIWMVERVLPDAVSMALWAALLIGSGVYMGALEPIAEGRSGWFRLWKALGLIMLIYGALLLIGAAAGGRDVLQPLRGTLVAGSAGGSTTTAEAPMFKRVRNLDELKRELAAARNAGKPVMLDFYADWCVSCKELEKFTFSNPAVQQALAGTVLLQADVSANSNADAAMLKQMQVPGLPSIHFFDRKGNERRAYRIVGYMGPQEFKAQVEKALAP